MKTSSELLQIHKKIWENVKRDLGEKDIYASKQDTCYNLFPELMRCGCCVGCYIDRKLSPGDICECCPFDDCICKNQNSLYNLIYDINEDLMCEVADPNDKYILEKLCDIIINAKFKQEISEKYDNFIVSGVVRCV